MCVEWPFFFKSSKRWVRCGWDTRWDAAFPKLGEAEKAGPVVITVPDAFRPSIPLHYLYTVNH